MFLCCFKGKHAAAGEQLNLGLSPKVSVGTHHEAAEGPRAVVNVKNEYTMVQETISILRCQLATAQGPWLTRLQSAAESVLEACSPASQVRLFGASPCGSVLVLLSSAGCYTAATVSGAVSGGGGGGVGLLSPGYVLPMPVAWLEESLGGGTTSATAATLAAGGVSSASGGLVILGSPAAVCPAAGARPQEPDVLVWQEAAVLEPLRAQAAADSHPAAKSGTSRRTTAAPAEVPDDWRQLLRTAGAAVVGRGGATAATGPAGGGVEAGVAAAADAASTLTVLGQLVPLRLGTDVVGGLLLVSPLTRPSSSPSSSPTVAVHNAQSAVPSRELVSGVAAAVAECCLGPHLADVQRVAMSACDLASARDLQGLASCLSSAATEALASELHVDFAVRLALVPYAPGARAAPQFGFLLTEQPAAAAAAAAAGGLTSPHAQHAQQGLAGHGPHGPAQQLQHQISGAVAVAGSEVLSRPSTNLGRALRGATRSLTPQSFADRFLAAKLSSGLPSNSGPSPEPLSGTLGSGPGPRPHPHPPLPLPPVLAGAASGVYSFQLTAAWGRRSGTGTSPGTASRTWKARPFSLESTLLAALSRKAAKVAGAPGHSSCKTGVSVTAPAVTASAAMAASALGYSSICVAMSAISNTDDGGAPPSAPAPMSRAGGGCAMYMTVGSMLAGPTFGCSGGGGGGGGPFRVYRMGGAAVPHVHAYVNDTDQPSGDVVLLLRTASTSVGSAAAAAAGIRVGGGGAHGAASASAAGTASGAGGGGGPASLVLVMGSVALPSLACCGVAAETVGGAVADDALVTAPRPVARSGTTSPASSLWPTPVSRAGGGGGGSCPVGAGGCGGGGFDVCVALYLTSAERLPASLLCAARNRAQVLLELLLPAAGACLSDSASAELQYLWDAVSGSAGGGGGGSGLVGRAASVPIGRLGVRGGAEEPIPQGAGGGGGSAVAVPGPGAGAGALRSGADAGQETCGGGGNAMLLASLSLRGGGLRDSCAGLQAGAPGAAAAAEADRTSLAQLFMTRGTNHNPTLLTTPENAAAGGGGGGGGGGLLGTANGIGWTTLAGITALAGPATRESSETAPRVPRSRLSNTTATGGPATGPGALMTSPGMPPSITTGTVAVVNPLMNSYNSLVSALMGTGSVTGRTHTHAAVDAVSGGGGGDTGVGGGGVSAASTHPLSLLPQQQAVAALSAPGVHRRTMLMLQQQQQAAATAAQQQQHLMLLHRSSLAASSSSTRLGVQYSSGGRVHLPPRRQVSDLLATMPLDAVDTLTMMRTNMDILVSSFWNTLRSQNLEAAPSPHADEDLRFLRLLKAIGGGGCSTVYLGLLHGLEVAVKVMKPPAEEEEGEGEEQQQQQGREGRQEGGSKKGGEGKADSRQLAPPAARQAQLRALMRGARELAVMTSISHPNIVQIYSYHTRVLVTSDGVEDGKGASPGSGRAPAGAAGGGGGGSLPRLTPVAELNLGSTQGPLQTVLIMECCDLGSLADALDSGMFANAVRNAELSRWRPGPRRSHTVSLLATIPAETSMAYGTSAAAAAATASGASGGGSSGAAARGAPAAGGTGMRAIYLTLLEVALALRHMHAMQLVHCDVKPANVLLKSSASDPRGFTCKLGDFGFVNLLQLQADDADDPRARPCMRYHEPVGTVTHLAPETMVQGSKLDHTVDIFAFGILMWEVFTGKAPYAEHAANNFRDVPYRVVREGMRPTFPSSAPLAFKSLAQACWSADAARRPNAAMLVGSLQRLMDAAARV